MKKGYYSKQSRVANSVENKETDNELDIELLRLIRFKIKKVNHSLEVEFGGYALLDELGYLCAKGSLEHIDMYCVTNDIYSPEDCTNSKEQLELNKKLQRALMNYSLILQ